MAPIKEDKKGTHNTSGVQHKQRGLFKKTRAGIELSREEVKAIELGRKKLRKEMRANGIRSKKEFELTASSMGLYFDKNKKFGLLLWLFHGRGLWALLGALLALLAVMFAFSLVTQVRGLFTISLSDGLFREGFSLSDSVGFENPTMRLMCEAAEDVPCVSISDIEENVNEVDGQHNSDYFAYTFYLRNEGESTVDYEWSLDIISESQNLSNALWVMVFEDDQMRFYAEAREDGTQEALPYFDDDTRGFLNLPLMNYAAEPENQYQLIAERLSGNYHRAIPISFLTEDLVTVGGQTEVEPWDVHKYTVVIWLEGDDPDCTNDKIGAHAGLEMNFRLLNESVEEPSKWEQFWQNLGI